MKSEVDRVSFEEIERRLDVASSIYPSWMRNDPDEVRWRLMLAFLLEDQKIFERVEEMAKPRKRGAPYKSDEEWRSDLEQLVNLSKKYETFAKMAHADNIGKGLPKQSQGAIIKSFLKSYKQEFNWLPKSEKTVQRLIRDGNRIRKFPRVRVGECWRILDPDQAGVFQHLKAFPLNSQSENDRAIQEVLGLRFNRPKDLEIIRRLKMQYVLRARAIRTLYDLPHALPLSLITMKKPNE